MIGTDKVSRSRTVMSRLNAEFQYQLAFRGINPCQPLVPRIAHLVILTTLLVFLSFR